MDSELQHIADKVRSGRRIDAAEALALWRGAPLWLLGELADGTCIEEDLSFPMSVPALKERTVVPASFSGKR